MKNLSDYTWPLRFLAQVPVLGALLFCIGKKPSRSSLLALANIVMLLLVMVLIAGSQALVWGTGIILGFVGLVLLATLHNLAFGKHPKTKKASFI